MPCDTGRMYFVYILRCADGSLYTGITTDLNRRLKEHRSGKGARYTRARGVDRFVFQEGKRDRSRALMREAEIKRLTREEKLELIEKREKWTLARKRNRMAA